MKRICIIAALVFGIIGCKTPRQFERIEYSVPVIQLRLKHAEIELKIAQEKEQYEEAVLKDIEPTASQVEMFEQWHKCTLADLETDKAHAKMEEIKMILKLVKKGHDPIE